MTIDPPRPALSALAARLGILPEYVDQTGHHRRPTSDRTRIALLAAMGIDGATEAGAAAALITLDTTEQQRLLPPVRVATREALAVEGIPLRRSVPAGAEWRLRLQREDGEVTVLSDRIDPAYHGAVTLLLGEPPPLGYHDLSLEVQSGDEVRAATQLLIVVPPRCVTPADLPGVERRFGITANLYTVRSGQNWGVGDFTDLETLLGWTATLGGAFVGVNPLHALRNAGHDISPYSPITRLYRNVIYIDVDRVPELADSAEARALLDAPSTRRELVALREATHIDYARVWALKRPILEALHRTFRQLHAETTTGRGRSYDEYLQAQSGNLTAFASWMALDDHFHASAEPRPAWWREWPDAYCDPGSAAVVAFREAHHEAYDFHRWLQFELDRQLSVASAAGRDAGLSLGLYQDLAIGSSSNGSDGWAYPELFLRGVSVGAPPDEYAPQGQNWGLPPIDPRQLAEHRYRYWIRLIRSALEHSGAVRIDHVLGLFRQFWIPDGMDGSEGAYVRFPTDDLFGILALESVRHRAVVVGEDLGTVPPEVPGTLKRWGVLSSRVMFFERDPDGGFRAADSYEPQALATADTHDMATLACFWEGRDLSIRRAVGLIQGDDAQRHAEAQREAERSALAARLRAEGVLTPPDPNQRPTSAQLTAAVHAFLGRTPSQLVGIALDDLAGEPDPVNVPGVGPDAYPSWTRRMRMPLEQLRTSPEVTASLRGGRP